MNSITTSLLRTFPLLPCLALSLIAILATGARADTDVLVGEVGQFEGPDDLHLDPATIIIAVDVFGDQDREVNGVTFRTDGQQNGAGTANEGDVSVTSSAANQINNWANAPAFSGADQTSADNLAEVMRDIRWHGAPNPVLVAIDGLLPNTPYEIQLLTNEGADRNRRWDIAVEGELVVDDYTSEGLHTQAWTPNNSAYYKGEFTSTADGTLEVEMRQNIGGQPSPGGDNNPILQGVIVHIAFIDVDGDGQNDPFEQKIIDADDGDALESLEDVLPGDDFDGDGLTNLQENGLVNTGTDSTNPDTDGDGVNDGADVFPTDPTETIDTDEDGVGDNGDNCPNDANPDQIDTDADGEGNACDPDDDNDGSTDVDEIANGTDPLNPDSDADGLLDGVENNSGTFVDANQTGTDPNNPDTDGGGIPDGFEVANGTDPNDPNDDPAAIAELHTVSVLPTGVYPFVAGEVGFTGYVHNDGEHSWLLVGRGRNGWEFDADGQGTIAEVGDSDLLGTPDAFDPAMYHEDIINDLIDNSTTDKDGVDIDLTRVEIRISRAADAEGTSYSEARWRPTSQTTWRSNFDDPQFSVEHEIVDGGGAAGADIGIRADGNTRDTEIGGNDGDRIFTWAWDGHALQQGFSYGSNVTTGANNDTSFLWENGTENHAIPYAELYIRLNNDAFDPAKVNLPDEDEDGIPDLVERSFFPDLPEDEQLKQLSADGDFDGDGLLDAAEYTGGTNPTKADTDGDGSDDAEEIALGTDPTNPDTDGDGLLDGVETNTGTFVGPSDTGTDPLNPDTDNDNRSDGSEVARGTDPTKFNEPPLVLAFWDFNDDAAPGVDLAGNAPDLELSASAMLTDDAGGFSGAGGDRGLDLGGFNNQGFAVTAAGEHFDEIPENNAYTIMLWQVNRTPATSTSSFWMHAPTSSGGQRGIQAHIPWSNGTIFFDQSGCCAGGSERLTVASGVIAEQWQHFVFRRDEDGNRDIFVDGVSVAQSGGAAPLEPFDGILHIGSDLNGANSLNGIIDEFAIWSRALEDGEIEGFYAAGLEGTSLGDLLFGTQDTLNLDVRIDEAGMLELSWDSAQGQLFNVRSTTDLSNGEPGTWEIFGGNADLEATPPRNVLTLPFPDDSERWFAVEAFPAPPETILGDDFESGIGEWTTGGAAGTEWQLGAPGAGPATANSPDNCFGTNLAGDYGFNADAWLRSPPIDLTTAAKATLRYAEFIDIEEGFDSGSIRVLDAADDSELAVIEDVVDGVSVDWEQMSESIPAAALGKIIKIEFRLTSDDIQNFAGWYIDDFQVTVP